MVLRLGSPRLGISSRDQNLGDRWYADLPDTGFTMSETLIVGQRVFAGSNGIAFELHPVSGRILQHSTVAQAAGGEVRLASDGIRLYAGVNGQVVASPLDSLAAPTWVADTGQGGLAVSVLVAGGVVAAGCNGFVFTFDPGSGRQLQKGRRKSSWSIGGDYDTRLATDGQNLYAGSHAYVYARALGNLGADLFTPVAVPDQRVDLQPGRRAVGRRAVCRVERLRRLDRRAGAVEAAGAAGLRGAQLPVPARDRRHQPLTPAPTATSTRRPCRT